MIKRSLLIIFLSISSSASLAMDKFLCVADKSTGFRFSENGSWEIAKFKVDDEKFFVQEVRLHRVFDREVNFEVRRLGSGALLHLCFKATKSTRIVCKGLEDFEMEIDTLRFQTFYSIGFLDGDSPSDTPNLTIGKCTKIQ